MKKIIYNSLYLLTIVLTLASCKDDKYGNYPGGTVSSYIPLFDLRNLHKGSDVTLTQDNMFGSTSISGVVVSDYSDNNFTDNIKGLLIIQDKKRLNSLRGIAVNIGDDASKFFAGDSVQVKVVGGILTRANGMLQIRNIASSAISKILSNKAIPSNGVPSSFILLDPNKYESTLVSIVEGTFNPLLPSGAILSGEKGINDGFENILIKTLPTATFANMVAPFSANYKGVVINSSDATDKLTPSIRIRKSSDITPLSSTNVVPDFVITGFMANPQGTDVNNEYIQFRANRDINFATTNFSVVTTNNAGASTPTGFPVNGWGTGGIRTYKFNLTAGTVVKGEFFYVGGTNKLINSTSSNSMASSKFIRSLNYSTTNGDGFGTKTNNLLANGGNAFGAAAFRGTLVNATTVPMDVIFVSAGGSLFSEGPPTIGYRIGKTDLYNPINVLASDPLSPDAAQPFYLQGSNRINFAYSTLEGIFYQVNGIFDTVLGKWTRARTIKYLGIENSSQITDIETAESTQIK